MTAKSICVLQCIPLTKYFGFFFPHEDGPAGNKEIQRFYTYTHLKVNLLLLCFKYVLITNLISRHEKLFILKINSISCLLIQFAFCPFNDILSFLY